MSQSELSNGVPSPQTPKLQSLALTEYTANPSPPERARSGSVSLLPTEALLPNGYPDVRYGCRLHTAWPD